MFKATFKQTEGFTADFSSGNGLTADFGSVTKVATDDYDKLINKPSIEGHVLQGDKTFAQLGLADLPEYEIDKIIYGG